MPRPSKRKKVRNNTKEQYEKTIIKLKGRAAKFHKSIITFWAKAKLQQKNKQESAGTIQSMDISDSETTSVLLCLIFNESQYIAYFATRGSKRETTN